MDTGAFEPIERGAFSGDTAIDAAPRGWLSPVNLAVLLGSLIAAALVVVLIFQANASNRDRDRALERERHSYDVMLVTRTAGASMASAEAALGRFATSADRGMGTSYYNNWTDAGAQISQLERLVDSDPTEVALVRQLRALYDARGEELGLTAQRAYYRQGWPALLLFNNAGHSKLIAQIDRTLAAIQDHESDKLQSRYDQSDAAAMQSNHLGQLLSVTGLLLAAAAGLLAWLALLGLVTQRRARAEADAADDRATWLEQAVAERTQELSDANGRLHREMVEREAAEARLRQMQKMEAVGQLTGGIAHDFNNMLAVVVGGLDLARRRLQDETEEVGRHIDNAMEGANRAAALTRRLLGFARAEPLLPEAVDPGRLIGGMSDLIDRTLGERVIVTTEVAAGAWPIWVDSMQFENAILNLAVNARDAMDGAGRLEITVDNLTLEDGEVGQAKAGDHVRVAVTDSGCGMTAQVLDRVFEPFFTTKDVGKGTGLGMSQIFGFVRQSGGDIAIRSAPGQGTTVSLYLPRGSREAAAKAATMPPPPKPIARSQAFDDASPGEPVLIVEDDPRVRVATTAAMIELGYRPIACESGEAALTLLAEHGDIRLMITDIVMPGMTGPELGHAVRARFPEVGILYVTGYAGEAGDGGELESEAVLRKPFTIAALEKAVGDAMHRNRHARAA